MVHYEQGDPASAILSAAGKLKAELLVAGALEKEAVHRQFLGNVARRLVREATCSVMLFTKPEVEPKPLRHIVFMAEYSDAAQRALRRALHLAEKENCERLYVIRSYTSFDKARAARRSRSGKGTARTLEEEEIALQEFILAAGETKVPIEARCIRGSTGFGASNFVQAVEADLLVVPMETTPEPNLSNSGLVGDRRDSLQSLDREVSEKESRVAADWGARALRPHFSAPRRKATKDGARNSVQAEATRRGPRSPNENNFAASPRSAARGARGPAACLPRPCASPCCSGSAADTTDET